MKYIALKTIVLLFTFIPTLSIAITTSAVTLNPVLTNSSFQPSPVFRLNNNAIGFGGGDNTPLRFVDYNTSVITSISDSSSGFALSVSDNYVVVVENPTGVDQSRILKCEIEVLINTQLLSSCMVLHEYQAGSLGTVNYLLSVGLGRPMQVTNDGWSIHFEDDGTTSSIVLSSPVNTQTVLVESPTLPNGTPVYRAFITDGTQHNVYIQKIADQVLNQLNPSVQNIEHIEFSTNSDIVRSQFFLPDLLLIRSINNDGDAVLSNNTLVVFDDTIEQEIYTCNLLFDQCASTRDITAQILPADLQAGAISILDNDFIIPLLNNSEGTAFESKLFREEGNIELNTIDALRQALPNFPINHDRAQLLASSPNGQVHLALSADQASNFSDIGGYLLTIEGGDISAQTTLVVTPESLLINSSNTASTNIDLQLNAQELFAIEVECTPSNDNITLSSRSAGSVFPAAPQSLLIDTTNLNENTFAQATSLSAFIDSDGNFVAAPEPITSSGIYASLVYNVQPVSGTTDVNCTAMGSDADGLLQSISVTNATITLDNGINPVDGNGQTVSGTVIIPLGVDPGSIVVTLTINDVSVTTTVDANGVFVFENIRMEDVTISVEAPNAVAECTAATVGSEAVSTGGITVYRGDINNDGTIDIADFTFLSSRFGLSEGENRFRARADLNKDGVINVQDLAILGSALGLAACDPLVN